VLGQPFGAVLTLESQRKFDDRLAQIGPERPCLSGIELNHAGEDGPDLPVRYALHWLGPDGALLLAGTDLSALAEAQQGLVTAQAALERDAEAARDADTRFRALLLATTDAMVLVSLARGRILDLNARAAGLLGSDRTAIAGSPLSDHLAGREEDTPALAELALAGADGAAEVVLRQRRSGTALRVTPFLFRAGTERLAVCRMAVAGGTDVAEAGMSEAMEALYRRGGDAVIILDAGGRIGALNSRALALLEAGVGASVRGRPFADFLARGEMDFRLISERAGEAGHLRGFQAQVVTTLGQARPVELTAVALAGPGSGMVVQARMAPAAGDRIAFAGLALQDDRMRNLAELVGSTPLQDIVGETTEVIERLCIETAIGLTRNNRAAAAEMLGLSRQSLYVKLRKYGMSSREDD
jgi:transcriptional regulator PpsR